MTIWVLHLSLTPEEETHLHEQEFLSLPFEGIPDLSRVTTPAQATQLLAALYPDDPPESLNRRLDRFWPIFHGMHVEDIIVLPLAAAKSALLAEVIGKYQYHVGADGEDMHRIPVRFYPKRVPVRVLRRHPELFQVGGARMREVTDVSARVAVRDQLPLSYNRFVKFKWLLVVFFVLGLVRMASVILRTAEP